MGASLPNSEGTASRGRGCTRERIRFRTNETLPTTAVVIERRLFHVSATSDKRIHETDQRGIAFWTSRFDQFEIGDELARAEARLVEALPALSAAAEGVRVLALVVVVASSGR